MLESATRSATEKELGQCTSIGGPIADRDEMHMTVIDRYVECHSSLTIRRRTSGPDDFGGSLRFPDPIHCMSTEKKKLHDLVCSFCSNLRRTRRGVVPNFQISSNTAGKLFLM